MKQLMTKDIFLHKDSYLIQVTYKQMIYRILPLIVSLLLARCYSSSVANYNYTQLTTISNPNQFMHLTYAPDYSLVIFYDSSSPEQPLIYDPFTWTQVKEQIFFVKPLFITMFQRDGRTDIIYSTKQHEIRLKIRDKRKDGWAEKEYIVATLKDTFTCDIKEIAVSSDGQMWASYCYRGPTVYWGNLTILSPASNITIINDSGIIALSFRLQTYTMVISYQHKPDYKTSRLFFFDPVINSTQQYPCQITQVVTSLTFITSYQFFFMQEKQNMKKERMINRYNFYNKQQDRIQLNNSAEGVKAGGKFLTMWRTKKGQEIFSPKQHKNLDFTKSFFKSQSNLWTSGFSPKGNFLCTMPDSGTKDIVVYQLCQGEGYYYNDEKQKCSPCQIPCFQCLLTASTCTKCISNQYFLNSNHSCLICNSTMPHCLTCFNGSTCLTCQNQYFFVNSSCLLCHELIPGCLVCSSSETCSICQSGYTLDSNSKCQAIKNPWLLVTLILGGVAVITIVILSVCLCRKRRKYNKQRDYLFLNASSLVMEGTINVQRRENDSQEGYLIPDSERIRQESQSMTARSQPNRDEAYSIPE